MTNKTTKHHSSDFYDSYDYSTFWQGRDYEDCSDNIAVSRFLKQTTMHRSIVDVGGGLGRLVPQYAGIYDTAVLLDPSGVQLEKTKFRIGAKYPNVSFVKGIAEELPFADGSVDTIVCIRVTHHIPNFSKPIEEYKPVL